DDTVVTGELAQALRTASPTNPSPTRVVHTGYTHTGWVRLAERVLQRFLGRDFWLPDFWGWLPMALRPRP
ncbi:hypothetical protein QCD71_25470, partial [Sphingomonas sp. PsM26]|nr:hypothetical protein [Sphingomonas sp. PsM26]